MGDIKFGASQFTKPAPERYRSFANGMIMFIQPALLVVVAGWGMPDKIENRFLLLLGFMPGLIKGVGSFLGNGQYYTSLKAAADVPPVEEPKS